MDNDNIDELYDLFSKWEEHVFTDSTRTNHWHEPIASSLRKKFNSPTHIDIFIEIFAPLKLDEACYIQLLNEIEYFFHREDLRIKVAQNINVKSKDDLKKYTKRHLTYLKRLIVVDENGLHISTNQKWHKKAQEVFLIHFGKYEAKHLDTTCLADIHNAVQAIRDKRTLFYDTTDDYHRYPKSAIGKPSLTSQMESLLQEFTADKEVSELVKKFVDEIYFREDRKK